MGGCSGAARTGAPNQANRPVVVIRKAPVAIGGSLAALLLGAGLTAGVHARRKGNDARYSPGAAGGSTTRSMVRRR